MILQVFCLIWGLIYIVFGFFCGYFAFTKNLVPANMTLMQKVVHYHGIVFIIAFISISILGAAFAGAFALVILGGK